MLKNNNIFLVFLLFFPVFLISQKNVDKIDIKNYFDYNYNNLSGNFPSYRSYSDSIVIIEKKSPTKAMIFSAIIPGSGQFYNKSYWKIPVIYGVAAYFAYMYNTYNDSFHEYSDKYEAAIISDDGQILKLATSYKSIREFYRDNRDSFIWYMSLLYLVNVLDAYVDAHLFDFNVAEDYRSLPGKIQVVPSIKFKINF
jgi:hypothetical protein